MCCKVSVNGKEKIRIKIKINNEEWEFDVKNGRRGKKYLPKKPAQV
jgi:hypothetical protein